jgi:hypothetical protein
MALLANILHKIFGHAPRTTPPTAQTAQTAALESGTESAPVTPTSVTSTPVAPESSAPQTVDVTAVLDGLAAENPERLNWRRSIVDLLKLLDMDSSPAARKSLADELHYPGDPNNSEEMNTWLHKQVIKKLAENGGKVPEELLQ